MISVQEQLDGVLDTKVIPDESFRDDPELRPTSAKGRNPIRSPSGSVFVKNFFSVHALQEFVFLEKV
jgi:hypothetical protein